MANRNKHKTDSVLKSYGYIERDTVYERLISLGNKLFGDAWKFQKDIDSYTQPDIEHTKYNTVISEDYLLYGAENGMCSVAGYVSTVQQMFHEYQHIKQNVDEWNRTGMPTSIKNINRMTDIIRRNFVIEYFISAYTDYYKSDPAEINAELYGIRETINYFKSDPLVSKQKAEKVLFGIMTASDYSHASVLDDYNIESMGDMLYAFKDLNDTIVHKPYKITFDESPESVYRIYAHKTDMSQQFLNNPRYVAIKEACDHCEDGKTIDKLLEQAIILANPKASNRVPRLKDELEACRKQMRHGVLVVNYDMVPIEKISYDKSVRLDGEHSDAEFEDAVDAMSSITDMAHEQIPDKEFTEAVNSIPGPDDNQSLTK